MIHTINLIQQHIDAGKRASCRHCPTALALIQHFGRLVYVSKMDWHFEDNPRVIYSLPVHMIHWIDRYDLWNLAEPTSFTIQT